VLCASLFFVIWGCDDEPLPCSDCGWDWGLGIDVNILLGTDTIRFLPGDSASTTVTIIVADDQGRAVEGQKVAISPEDPNLGFIEYVNPDLRDTTNAMGRVECIFRVLGQAGDQIIRASAGGRSDEATIAIRVSLEPILFVDIDAEPHIIFLYENEEDSVVVTVQIADEFGNPIVGVSLQQPTSISSGRVGMFPPTDALGVARTWWYLDEVGEQWIACRAGGLHDTAWVDVYPPQLIPWTLNISAQHDSISISSGEVASNLVIATLRDGFGSAVAGEYIEFRCSDGWLGDYSFTDSLGHSNVWWITDHPSDTDSVMVTSRFDVLGLEDTVRFWVHEE
jgi:hypothetical protein